jgi:hypothetical protein
MYTSTHLRHYFDTIQFLLAGGAGRKQPVGGLTTRSCHAVRSKSDGLGLHVYGDERHCGVMVTKVFGGGDPARWLPDPPRRGDVIVGINGRFVLGLGLDAVMMALAAADEELVLNLVNPMDSIDQSVLGGGGASE